MERVYVNVQRYGNMSSATIPAALCVALEEQRVRPGGLLLMPGFGGGELPGTERTALQMIGDLLAAKTRPTHAASPFEAG
jgi:hypothetical protein